MILNSNLNNLIRKKRRKRLRLFLRNFNDNYFNSKKILPQANNLLTQNQK